MCQYFDANQQTEIKSDGTPVTIADKHINELVITLLAKAFPNDGLIGEEESTTEYGMGRKWFCDPIDGTLAYTWGTPTSTFSLGLVVGGRPSLGVVYDPYLNRMYTAARGKGSFCNDKRLAVSTGGIAGGIVATTSDIRKVAHGSEFVRALVDTEASLAAFSGAVYKSILVATGRFVGFVDEVVNAHDMAAVHTIVEAAGGKVSGMDGGELDYTKPFKGAVVSNAVAYHGLINALNAH